MSRIIITDPHGCFKTLMALIAKLPPGVPITFAGDYIDRGPDSRKVLEFIKNGKYDCVVGNHEIMMIDELHFGPHHSDGRETVKVDNYHGIWTMNGGDVTLDNYVNADGSYDIAALKEHLEWLKSLPYHILYPEVKNAKGQQLLVTHSTAAHVWDEYPPEHDRFKNCVTWERDPMPPKIPEIFNVYGHTPQYYGPTVKDHFACIDGGCYYKRQGYGKLFALQYPEMIVIEQENVEDPK